MKSWMLTLVMASLVMSGCTNAQLRRSTVTQASTLTEVQHELVLNNLAAFAFDPNAIPFHATLSDGTAQITDNGSIATQLLQASMRSLTLGATRTATDQWSMTPVTDSMTLRLLRVAYRRVYGDDRDLYSEDLANELAHELKKQTAQVDDIRTTNQMGNSSLQAIASLGSASSSSSPTEHSTGGTIFGPLDYGVTTPTVNPKDMFKSIVEGLNNLADKSKPGVLVSTKTDPNILGFSGDSISRLLYETSSVISSNDNRIVLPWERLGYYPPSNAGSEFNQVRLPDGSAEKITVPASYLAGSVLNLLDPRDHQRPVETIDFASYKLPPFDNYEFNRPDQVQQLRSKLSKIKRDIDKKARAYYGYLNHENIEISSSVDVEEFDVDTKSVKLLRIVVSFSENLANSHGKIFLTFPTGPVVTPPPSANPGPIPSAGPDGGPSPAPIQAPVPAPLPVVALEPIPSENLPRYIAVTPLVAELRRQIADVEHALVGIQPGWIGRSRDKHDVPHDACYKAAWKDCNGVTYVWVCPQGKAQFEDFTIKILKLSALIKPVSVSGAAGVKFTPGSSAATLSPGGGGMK